MTLTKYDKAELPKTQIRNDGFISRTFLLPQYAIVRRGRSGALSKEELRMPADQATEASSLKFETNWQAEVTAAQAAGRKPSLLTALRKSFGWEMFWAGFWKSVWSIFVILGAYYFVRSLVQYVTPVSKGANTYNVDPVPGTGWILSAAFFLDSVLVGVALQRMGDCCVRAGIKVRSALMTAVFRKTFALSSVHNEGAGNVVSLVSTDCGKLYEGVLAFHNVWTAPLETAAIIALLLSNIKEYGLPALGIVVFVLPLQYYFGMLIARAKVETVEVSDSRVLRMQEILLAIKLVKFYNWQDSFAKQVSDVREKELQLMHRAAVVKTLNLCLVFAVPPVIALVIYATYIYNVQPLDATLSFTILSLFNTLRFPLVVLPKALRGTSEAMASIRRLEQFLLIQEAPDAVRSKVVEARFEDAVLSHHGSSDEFKVHVPRFEVKPGEVAAIVGRVGSGKSSMFTAVLDNMRVESGLVSVGGRVAYVPQSPWVQNLSLRDNILFGLPYDEALYKQVIHACALELDLQILPNGDQTMAGERGINLSGGQRQRVCLARAAYHPADIVLLDNPLSAVDQHTALHIFNYCIKGMLKDKAVIWITHQLELLPSCTNISVMEDGHMTYFGPYDADMLNKRLPVDHLLFATVEAGESGVQKVDTPQPSAHSTPHPSSSGLDALAAKGHAAAPHMVPVPETSPFAAAAGTSADDPEARADAAIATAAEAAAAAPSAALMAKQKSTRMSFQRSTEGSVRPSDSVSNLISHLNDEEKKEAAAAGGAALPTVKSGVVTDISNKLKRMSGRKSEDKDVQGEAETALEESPEQIAAKFNGVAPRLTAYQALMVFLSSGGLVMAAFALYIFMATQTCRIYSDLWIRWMAADFYQLYPNWDNSSSFSGSVYDTVNEANTAYILGYTSFVVCFIALLLCRDTFFSIWHIRGSTRLHNALFSRVLKAPILFFLRTPVGDVLNSFAKDQDTLDETLPDTLHMTTIYLMILLTSLAIVTVSIYYYAALTAALLGAFLIMQQFYLPAATLLKRWAGETASQVYVHVDESLHGMDVIKAFDAVNYFIQENVVRINDHHLALFNTEQCHLWLAFWCDFFGAIMVLATCLLSVGLKDTLSSSAVGLAISNTIQVLVFFTWVVRGAADTVSMWDAVERVATFSTNIPEEVQVALTTDHAGTHPGAAGNGAGGGSSGGGGLEMVKVQLAPDSNGEGNGAAHVELGNWPSRGDIKFQGLCLRYYPGAPLALKYVTFHIRDKEKIGVVGRTGSGKTTLLMALFRMFEPAAGSIVIDGQNISALPLGQVRSRLAIIPQEPVMFKGTVRSNLDPFEETSDEELWHALELVHLKAAISEMPGGLDAPVAEGGSNFSLGQKQLVCMGRCVLKKTRILVLDEATAAMDLQTDALIQKTIRRVFAERTTITIAHRLDTIIFSDRILAMAQGQVREFAEPDLLLGQKDSMFNKLVDDTGPHASGMLRRMAAEGPKDDRDEE